MDLNYQTAATGEKISVEFPTDFDISIAYKDSRTGETILDLTGDATIRMSDLLGMMTAEALSRFVDAVAPQMAAIAKGLGDE